MFVVDMYTGEELWRKTDQVLTLGQIYNYESFNQHGAQAFLWGMVGTTWNISDAFTGDVFSRVHNALPGGMQCYRGMATYYFTILMVLLTLLCYGIQVKLFRQLVQQAQVLSSLDQSDFRCLTGVMA